MPRELFEHKASKPCVQTSSNGPGKTKDFTSIKFIDTVQVHTLVDFSILVLQWKSLVKTGPVVEEELSLKQIVEDGTCLKLSDHNSSLSG